MTYQSFGDYSVGLELSYPCKWVKVCFLSRVCHTKQFTLVEYTIKNLFSVFKLFRDPKSKWQTDKMWFDLLSLAWKNSPWNTTVLEKTSSKLR